MGGRRRAGGGGSSSSGFEKCTTEYREKRAKNNIAVKRSRDKTKAKARESQVRVQQLQSENEQLQSTVDAMTCELRYLKDLLISQAGTSEYLSPDMAADLEELLQEDGESPSDLVKLTTVLNEVRRIQSMQKNTSTADNGNLMSQPHLYGNNGGSGTGGGNNAYANEIHGNQGYQTGGGNMYNQYL